MAGQCLVVVILVSQACSCPVFSQVSHMCCSVSNISLPDIFLQKEQKALSACPGMLFQYDPHLILLVCFLLHLLPRTVR